MVLLSFALQSQLGEVWAGLLILFGALIGVSGLINVILILAYYALIPVIFIGAGWLVFDSWNDLSFADALRKNGDFIKIYWVVGLFGTPLTIWQLNQSWFFLVRNFALNEEAADTLHPELIAFGLIQISDSYYDGAATITEQGLILDRRNFKPVVLPWNWVISIDSVEDSSFPNPVARVRMRNDENEFVTMNIPWNEELLNLNTARLAGRNGQADTDSVSRVEVDDVL